MIGTRAVSFALVAALTLTCGWASAQDFAPTITGVARDVALPQSGQSVTVTATVEDDMGPVTVELWVDAGNGFVAQPMFDDGFHGDGVGSDGLFGATIGPAPSGALVRYYVAATDTFPQTVTVPADAPSGYLAYTVDYTPPALVINGLLASNLTTNADDFNQTDDWLEIRNRGATPVAIGGMFLTDILDLTMRWELPGLELEPGAYLLVWADDDDEQGPLHTDFKISKGGGRLGLFDTIDHGNVPIHTIRFGPQTTDISFGFPAGDGDVPEYLASPTPESSNETSPLFSDVCINEFLATSQVPGLPDWVELYNRGPGVVDISGWHLSDDDEDLMRYTFPPGSVLAPGGHLLIDDLGFGLAAGGENDVLVLTDVDASVGRDFYDFGQQLDDVSEGRFPDGTANWHHLSPSSPLVVNACSPIIQPPAPIDGVQFPAKNGLFWNDAVTAGPYDVVRGELSAMRTIGAIGTSVECAANNFGHPEAPAEGVPPAEDGWFYLVRRVNLFCGFGSWEGGAAQVAPRDAALTGVCP